MAKRIWIMDHDRNEMIHTQRSVNSAASIRAICMLSQEALRKNIEMIKSGEGEEFPSLILIDHRSMEEEEYRSIEMLREEESLSGVPILFLSPQYSEEIEKQVFEHGGLMLLRKPLTPASVGMIEHFVWQFNVAVNAENKMAKQAGELNAAKEILRLNQQLEARNQFLHQVFGRYFSDEVLERILENPEGASIGGEKKEVTILLADLRGFTAISQEMESDSVMDVLNFYFDKMVDVISSCKGTVIEFLGDGILAVFGAPIQSEDHTENAFAAAIRMQNEMIKVNRFCEKNGYEQLNMGIGIHRGEVFIGNIGSEKAMRYNVIGRAVNECSRIESYCLGGQVLISDYALGSVNAECVLGNSVEINAKGLRSAMKVHELEGVGADKLLIAEERDDAVYCGDDDITLALFPIINKIVRDKAVKTHVISLAQRFAYVRTEQKDELELFTDLRIRAEDSDQKILFEDIYGRVIDSDDTILKIYFTRTNKTYHNFLEGLKGRR